jgi:MFS family permease
MDQKGLAQSVGKPVRLAGETIVESNLPMRLDRLPWHRWHWLIVTALGVTWLLDGLEVTLAGSLAGILRDPRTLGLTDLEIGLSATAYLAGAVAGALIFGYATDRLGRKRLFTVTLLVYLLATAATAFSWNFWSYAIFRALTGAGIGGEYSAINSAIDELIPARVRGRVDLGINAAFWIGAAMGAAASIVLLEWRLVPVTLGWRLAFGIGATLSAGILVLRRFVPESPRWLTIHGRHREALRIVEEIEGRVDSADLPICQGSICLQVRKGTSWSEIWHSIVRVHRTRSLLGLILMSSQAFFYNGLFFTYALVLVSFYGVPAESVGRFIFPFALGNFLGPLVLGRLFDTVGRKPMIAATYGASGTLLALVAWLFARGQLTAFSQGLAWTAIFFIASAAASSAYLTVSEIFPLEVRALAIAIFYASGTLVGGVGAPALFGALIASGSRTHLALGYLAAAGLMIFAAAAELVFGVSAERQPLESVAEPLSAKRI